MFHIDSFWKVNGRDHRHFWRFIESVSCLCGRFYMGKGVQTRVLSEGSSFYRLTGWLLLKMNDIHIRRSLMLYLTEDVWFKFMQIFFIIKGVFEYLSHLNYHLLGLVEPNEVIWFQSTHPKNTYKMKHFNTQFFFPAHIKREHTKCSHAERALAQVHWFTSNYDFKNLNIYEFTHFILKCCRVKNENTLF